MTVNYTFTFQEIKKQYLAYQASLPPGPAMGGGVDDYGLVSYLKAKFGLAATVDRWYEKPPHDWRKINPWERLPNFQIEFVDDASAVKWKLENL